MTRGRALSAGHTVRRQGEGSVGRVDMVRSVSPDRRAALWSGKYAGEGRGGR